MTVITREDSALHLLQHLIFLPLELPIDLRILIKISIVQINVTKHCLPLEILGMICLLFRRKYADFSNASDAPAESKSFRPLPSKDDFFGSNRPSNGSGINFAFNPKFTRTNLVSKYWFAVNSLTKR